MPNWREHIPQLIFGLIYLYVVARFIWPLHLPLPAKLAGAAILFVASQYLELCRLSSGSRFSPEFPRSLVILLNWAFGGLVLLALLQLLLDGGLLLAWPFRGMIGAPDSVRFGIGALAATLAALGVQQAIRVPPLKDMEVGIRGLAPQFDGYTLLHLTDLHISRLFPASWARAVVERSNALGTDVIVITGDLIDGTPEARRADVEPLRDLKAPDGVYVVSGNHERIFGYRRWLERHAALGMRVLDNDHVVLERDGGRLTLAGFSDLSVREAGRSIRDPDRTIGAAPRNVPVILLDHQPGDFADVRSHRPSGSGSEPRRLATTHSVATGRACWLRHSRRRVSARPTAHVGFESDPPRISHSVFGQPRSAESSIEHCWAISLKGEWLERSRYGAVALLDRSRQSHTFEGCLP